MRLRTLPLVLASLLLMAGCRDPKITTYRIPKEKDPAPPAAASAAPAPAPGATMANTAVTTAEGPGLIWTPPSHWTAKPASAMRKGSYAIAGDAGASADLSITAFPGDVGGDLANVNRWRGQIQLPPIAVADLATTTTHLDYNGLHLTYVDLTSTSATAPQRVLGAIVPHGEATWFFKLTGPAPLIAREQAAFADFLKTIRPAGATP